MLQLPPPYADSLRADRQFETTWRRSEVLCLQAGTSVCRRRYAAATWDGRGISVNDGGLFTAPGVCLLRYLLDVAAEW